MPKFPSESRQTSVYAYLPKIEKGYFLALFFLRPQRLDRHFPMPLPSRNPPICSTVVFVIMLIRILRARSSLLVKRMELLFSPTLLKLLALPFVFQVLDIAIGVISDVFLDKGAVAVGVLKELHLEVVDLTLQVCGAD